MPRELFHDGAGNAELPLRWLIRIGGRANSDTLPFAYSLEFLPQQPARVLFYVNLAFKIQAVPQLHEFVRITGIAVLAGKFTTAVRINHPGKRHARRNTAREHAAVL